MNGQPASATHGQALNTADGAPTACDVLALGSLAVDDVLYLERFPQPDDKITVTHRSRRCGGLAGTALLAAARFGARAAYAGWFGNDELCRFIGERLRAEGIDLRHAEAWPGGGVVHSTVLVDPEQRTRTVLAYRTGEPGPADDAPPLPVIRGAKVLLIDHHGLPGTLRAVRAAADFGVPIVADFERDSGPLLAEILPLVDHLVVGLRFARGWFRDAGLDPAEAVRRFWNERRQAVVITHGEHGCHYRAREDNAVRHQPAYRVATRDTTGCGDVFHGVYAALLARDSALAERIRLASAAAALRAAGTVDHADNVPDERAVMEFLAVE
ncbi:PfkB family carbohydrate kinase [Thermopirellula anaerolimosa]